MLSRVPRAAGMPYIAHAMASSSVVLPAPFGPDDAREPVAELDLGVLVLPEVHQPQAMDDHARVPAIGLGLLHQLHAARHEPLAIDLAGQYAIAEPVAHHLGQGLPPPGCTDARSASAHRPPQVEVKVQGGGLPGTDLRVVQLPRDCPGHIEDHEPHDLLGNAVRNRRHAIGDRRIQLGGAESVGVEGREVDDAAGMLHAGAASLRRWPRPP